MPKKFAFAVFALLLALRLLLLEYPALIDPTEGRYAYVAQEMVVSGDWVTPKLPGAEGPIPYLGKPPLHFWISAALLTLFGMEEWVARLPSFLALLVVCWCVFEIGKAYLTPDRVILSPLIVVSSGLGWVTSGLVIIDLTLTATVCLAVTGLLLWKKTLSPGWSYLIFFGLSLAFLTKGPIGIALFALPVILSEYPFSFKRLNQPDGILKLPWLRGIGICFLTVAPWFIFCELRNPGFIKYFFINENLLRFFVSEYGDRYGNGHHYPYGASWWMFCATFVPWTPLLAYTLYLRRRAAWSSISSLRNWAELDYSTKFFVSWFLAPLAIFTFSKQLHIGYIVPALPGAALLLGSLLEFELKKRVCSTHRFFIALCGLLSVSFFAIGLRGSASADLVLLSILPLVISLCAFYAARKPFTSVLYLILGIALSMTSSMSLALTAFAGVIGDRNSTEAIMDCMANDDLNLTPDITVFGSTNFSAMYYSRAWEEEFPRKVEVVTLTDDSADLNESSDIIIRRGALKNASSDVRNNYDLMTSEGRWVWLHKRNVPITVSKCQLVKPFEFLPD